MAPLTIPNVLDLPTFDELQAGPPYHVLIHTTGGGKSIVVESSHSDTLQLLSDYLELRLEDVFLSLHPSAFSLAGDSKQKTIYDRLEISSDPHLQVSVTIVLRFIEGVLGYERVHSTTSSWAYRRAEAFAKASAPTMRLGEAKL